jgi:epoxide hydrolase-like protein
MPIGPTPFRLAVPESEPADLRERLRRTRWPEPATVEGWARGVPLEYLRELCAYWADGYDWRRRPLRRLRAARPVRRRAPRLLPPGPLTPVENDVVANCER